MMVFLKVPPLFGRYDGLVIVMGFSKKFGLRQFLSKKL